MTKNERIKAALLCDEVDRVPVNLWMYSSTEDQDPRSLAEYQVDLVKKYDYDYMKIIPQGLDGVRERGEKIKIFNKINQPPI